MLMGGTFDRSCWCCFVCEYAGSSKGLWESVGDGVGGLLLGAYYWVLRDQPARHVLLFGVGVSGGLGVSDLSGRNVLFCRVGSVVR